MYQKKLCNLLVINDTLTDLMGMDNFDETVEYLEEEDQLEEAKDNMLEHTMVLQVNPEDSSETFRCMQCDSTHDSIEDFYHSHGITSDEVFQEEIIEPKQDMQESEDFIVIKDEPKVGFFFCIFW